MDWKLMSGVVACAIGAALMPTALAGGSGDCCVANGTPGCDDEECQDIICSNDSFCCTSEWDQNCADEALFLCEACNMGCSGLGSCYQVNGTPGCGDFECCTSVCSFDPSCCDVTWDQDCVDSAFTICGQCGTTGAGNCCEANGTPGCSDTECCETVCVVDPFCCNFNWDALCADHAQESCTLCTTGACCIDGSCSIMPDTLCFASSGTYQGDGEPCGIFTCGIPILGACCYPDGDCSTTASSTCTANGGTFQGAFTTCADSNCGPCIGDADGDGDCDSDDLNELLGDFGCIGNSCSGDLDGSGAVNSTDLNILLSNFGCGT